MKVLSMRCSVILLLGLMMLPFQGVAQLFEPSSAQLPDAQVGEHYSTYILATIPDSTEVSGVDVAAMLIQQFPPLALFITEIQGLNYPLDITSVEFTVTGMPEGIGRTCTPSTCRFVSENVGSVVFAGTPTQPGTYTVNIASYTRGTLDISQLSADFGGLGLPNSFVLPSGLHTLFDQQYLLTVAEPNGVSEPSASTELTLMSGSAPGQFVAHWGDGRQALTRLSVMDLTGRTVFAAGPLSGSKAVMDLSGLGQGIFVLRAEWHDASAAVKFVR